MTGFDSKSTSVRPFSAASTLVALLMVFALGCGEGERRDAEGATAHARSASTGTQSRAADATLDEVRSEARGLAEREEYLAAVALLEEAEMHDEADRMRRRGARSLYRAARRALRVGRHKTAHRLATESRRLRKTAAARKVQRAASAQIAIARAAARERRRLARIARDQRICSSAEKRTVRSGGGTPPGCAAYAAKLAARRAEREAEKAPAPSNECDPNYEGACLKPDSPDYDCAGGSGDGPDYTGPVRVVGDDPYGLDRDGDGYACEAS